MAEWRFSPEIEKEINELCLIIKKNHQDTDNCNKWIRLRDFNPSKPEIIAENTAISDVNSASNLSAIEEEGMMQALLEAVQSNSQFDITQIAAGSLGHVFSGLQDKLGDQGFSNVCKMISDWDNSLVIDECISNFIYPKLQEKNESSVCMISSIKELTEKMPDKICNNVLTPLLLNKNKKFKDVELLNAIFPILSDVYKDSLISAMTKKNSFEADDWQMFIPLINDLLSVSLGRIVKAMNNFADEFSSCQIFAKLLVAICKNNECSSYKDQLIEIAGKNKTLMKRTALKCLESF